MSVSIRLARRGRKKVPFYYIVVQDKEKTPKGGYLEKLGYYNPAENPVMLELDVAKAEGWIKNGAKPSPTVARLITLAKDGVKPKAKKSKKFGKHKVEATAAAPAAPTAPAASAEATS